MNKQKNKTPGDIIILHMCTIMTIISCMVPEIYFIPVISEKSKFVNLS